MTRSLAETLGAFVAETNFTAIPASVVTRAKVSLVHNLTMAMAGRKREQIAHTMAKTLWPMPEEATLLRDGTRVSMEAAAFANGSLMHARSQDDTHADSTSHPGGAVMPAVFAVAEAEGRSGAEMLTAVVLGYETLGRIGRDFDHLVSGRGFRAAAVFGPFGAAAAAAKLFRLSGSETGHAIGLAAHLAGGLSQVWEEGSAEFALQLGFAARNGILAARAAQAGATAARWILEGKGGFFRAYAGASGPPEQALDRLGETWQLSDVTVKAYPVCAILQGPVDAMLQIARSHDLNPTAVAEVVLWLSPYEASYPGIDNPGPFASSTATKMSAQYCVALALLDRRLTIDGLLRLADTAIGAMAARVSVVADPALVSRLSRLQVRLTDGRLLSQEIASPVGRPSFDAIAQFARAMASEMDVKPAAIDHLVKAVTELEQAPDLSRLFDKVIFEAI